MLTPPRFTLPFPATTLRGLLLLLLLSFGARPVLHAQAMQDWSAIETTGPAATTGLTSSLTSGSRAGKRARLPVPATTASAPATVALQGAAAALLPNALQPVPTARLKSAAEPLTAVLATLTQLRPVRFSFLPGQGEDGPQFGLLPGNLARVYPELVRTNLMTGTQSINTAQLTPILVEAIKELHSQLQLVQGQQLQLAEAYARLVNAANARAASGIVPFLRRKSGSPAAQQASPGPEEAPVPSAPVDAPEPGDAQ